MKKHHPDIYKIVHFLNPRKRVILLAALPVVGGLSIFLVAMAASSLSSAEPENGTLSGNVAVTSDSSASDGSAVMFGSSPQAQGFITTSGRNFMLNGETFRFVGFNAYGMEGCYNGTAWTKSQLDTYFSNLPANGVTRIWAFKSYGTTPLTTILTEAAKYNQHLILTLGDDNASCGETDYSVNGDQTGKTEEFYTTGWQGAYLNWVNTVVPMFKDNKSIMMWEVANEPGNIGYRPTSSEMQAYLAGASNAIRANDPNHLISVGADYDGDFGGAEAYKQAMALPNIDAISFHDYSYEYENGRKVSAHFTVAENVSKELNKPFYAGEDGVRSGSGCTDVPGASLTENDRVSFFETKASNYFSSGIGGIMYWDYEPTVADWAPPCHWYMQASDPMVSTVKNYVIPPLDDSVNLSNGLLGNWPFNGNADDAALGDNGTVHGATLIDNRFGQADSAYSFDGISSYIQLSGSPSYDVGIGESGTFSLWMKTSNNTNTEELLYKNGSCLGWYIQKDDGGVGFYDHTGDDGCSGSVNDNHAYAPGNFADDKWHMITGTVNRANGTMKIYIDGTLNGAGAIDNTDNGIGDVNTKIGAGYDGDHPFAGSLDDVRIYNRALSAAEVQALYSLHS